MSNKAKIIASLFVATTYVVLLVVIVVLVGILAKVLPDWIGHILAGLALLYLGYESYKHSMQRLSESDKTDVE